MSVVLNADGVLVWVSALGPGCRAVLAGVDPSGPVSAMSGVAWFDSVVPAHRPSRPGRNDRWRAGRDRWRDVDWWFVASVGVAVHDGAWLVAQVPGKSAVVVVRLRCFDCRVWWDGAAPLADGAAIGGDRSDGLGAWCGVSTSADLDATVVGVRVGGVRREPFGDQHKSAVACFPGSAFHCSKPHVGVVTRRNEIAVTNEEMDKIALHRYAVIAEALPKRLTPAERGAIVRWIADRIHTHPDGTERVYSRATIDRWIRAWRRGALDGLRPQSRSDAGNVRSHPELAEVAASLRVEVPARSAAQIADIIWHRHMVRVSERTIRNWLLQRGLHRTALAAEPKVFGRFEAERPNQRWITDVLVGPFIPFPKTAVSVRARLFLIVDDHSRLLVYGRFMPVENTRAGQDVLRQAIVRRGVPEVLYCDNGAPFHNAALARTCAVLGVRLVHSKPYSPQGRGKQERLNRYIRERFLAEIEHTGIATLAELNDRFEAWAEQVANLRVHAETGQRPIDRWHTTVPTHPDPAKIIDAFRWAAVRKVTKTATISLEGNIYAVEPALAGRRVEVRYDPEDLTRLDIYLNGAPAGIAVPFKIGRHVAKTVPQAARPAVEATGIDYLGMVLAKHEDETIGTIHYRQVPLNDGDIDGVDGQVA